MKKLIFVLAIFLATTSSVKAFDWVSEQGIFKNLTVPEFKQITSQSSEQALGFESLSGTEIREGSGDFAEHLTPAKNNTYDLGSTSKQWRNLYVNGSITSGGITATGNLSPNTDATYDLGTVAARWRNLFLSGNLHTSGTIAVGTSGTLNATSTIYHGLNIGTRSGFNTGGMEIAPNGFLSSSDSIYAFGNIYAGATSTDHWNFNVSQSGVISASGAIRVPQDLVANSNPRYSFIGDTDTGMYSRAANTLSFNVNGNLGAELTASVFNVGGFSAGTVSLKNGAGTAASPALTFATDLDTGVNGYPGNFLAVSTGGVERMRWDSNGNVMLGGNLATNLNSSLARFTIYNGGMDIGSGVATTTVSSTFFAFNQTATNASGTFYIDPSGNVNSSGTISASRFGFATSTGTGIVLDNSITGNTALGFSVGNTIRWLTDLNGTFLPSFNNSYDIGGTSLAPRTFYLASSLLSQTNNIADIGEFGSAIDRIVASTTLIVGRQAATTTINFSSNTASAGQGTCLVMRGDNGTQYFVSIVGGTLTASTANCQ